MTTARWSPSAMATRKGSDCVELRKLPHPVWNECVQSKFDFGLDGRRFKSWHQQVVFLPWDLLQNLLLFRDFYTKVNLRNVKFTSKFALHLRNVTVSI